MCLSEAVIELVEVVTDFAQMQRDKQNSHASLPQEKPSSQCTIQGDRQ